MPPDPDFPMPLRRRAFLASAAAALSAASVGCKRRSGAAAPGFRTLTAEEAVTLEAWCEALIPADQDPGSTDAMVPRFIDIQLTRKYRPLRPKYRQALAAFARWQGLGVDERLALMEQGKAPREFFEDGGKDAFEMVLAHTMQGFYGSPRHGGNREFASWKMLGVSIMPVRGRQHYRIGAEAGK